MAVALTVVALAAVALAAVAVALAAVAVSSGHPITRRRGRWRAALRRPYAPLVVANAVMQLRSRACKVLLGV